MNAASSRLALRSLSREREGGAVGPLQAIEWRLVSMSHDAAIVNSRQQAVLQSHPGTERERDEFLASVTEIDTPSHTRTGLHAAVVVVTDVVMVGKMAT